MEAILKEDPIIGVLAQETFSIQKLFPNEKFKCYICAGYVKFLESAGARVVPIWIGQDENYYREVVTCTNGLLFPGGATWFTEKNGYAVAGQILFDLAVEKNNRGVYYPIFGICLGMELLIHATLKGKDIRTPCSAYKLPLALDFKKSIGSSKLFSKSPNHIIENLAKMEITYNYHQFCIIEEHFLEENLDEYWQILSINKDKNNLEFISTIESKLYPFYGVIFHPEKTQFNFVSGKNIPHTYEAIEASQYLGNFFVNEARKNDQTFPDKKSEVGSLIFNYNPKYTGLIDGIMYEQLYLFTEEDCILT